MKELQYLNESENIAKKERFGLFSHPLGLSFNEDTYSRKNKIPHDKSLKRLEINPPKEGKHGDALFQEPGYITINDHYVDPYRPKQIEQKQKVDKIPHAKPFRDTDTNKTKIKAPYEYRPTEFPKKYDTRDQNGNVKIKPRKFYTSSNKNRLFSQYEFMADPYDRLKQQDIKEQIDHKKKMLTTQPFKNNCSQMKFFENERKTYGDWQMKDPKKVYDYQRPWVNNIHDSNFKPSFPCRKGHQKTFTKYNYIEENCFNEKK